MRSQQNVRVDYPDDDLKDRIQSYLSSRHFPAFRELDVEVDNGKVTLSGKVDSYYEKQVALNCCGRVAGVLQTVDDVEVAKSNATRRHAPK